MSGIDRILTALLIEKQRYFVVEIDKGLIHTEQVLENLTTCKTKFKPVSNYI